MAISSIDPGSAVSGATAVCGAGPAAAAYSRASAAATDRIKRKPPSARFPVEDHAPGVPGHHDLEALLELAPGEVVGDDRLDVEAALEHHVHLVPGLVHLAAVDPLDGEHGEDHRVPVDGHLLVGDAQH